MTTAFNFTVQGDGLVDMANGLRIRGYSGPDYSFKIAVEPLSGPQSGAWPLSERAYFEFGHFDVQTGAATCRTLNMVIAHPSFERHHPGRTDELLDIVVPLIIPMDLFSFPVAKPGVVTEIPGKMREIVARRGSYFRHRDEPDTHCYRMAHPTKEDVARYKALARAARSGV